MESQILYNEGIYEYKIGDFDTAGGANLVYLNTIIKKDKNLNIKINLLKFKSAYNNKLKSI